MDNSEIKKLRLHGIAVSPALNDGFNGLLRIEAHQWITDAKGNVTDIKHRLEAGDLIGGIEKLKERAEYMIVLHVELKP